jgi:hypothetical protein
MKYLAILVAAALCLPAQWAAAQSGIAKNPESTMKAPADPGMRTIPPPVEKSPTDPGAVVTPPRTGTEEIVKTPNKAIDPKIDDATTDIDRRNRKKSEQKSAQ